MCLFCGNDLNIFVECRRLAHNTVSGFENVKCKSLEQTQVDFISITDCANFTPFNPKLGHNNLLMRPNNPSINRINELPGVF